MYYGEVVLMVVKKSKDKIELSDLNEEEMEYLDKEIKILQIMESVTVDDILKRIFEGE